MTTQKPRGKPGRIEQIADPSYFPARPPMQAPPAPASADYQSVISFLKSFAPDLGTGFESLLSIPKDGLFRTEDPGKTFFSADREFRFLDIINGAKLGGLKTEGDEYGLGVYSGTSSFTFVLVDMKRRIIIEERIFSQGGEPGWKNVESALRSALSMAGREPGKIIMSSGGFVRAV
ncbi:MAG: hypothetical protein AB1324_02245 [Candidatus Micrarchaeota archaeon]